MTRETGFTLIELMIVVVIIAIVASVALPSYQAYVERARRGGECVPFAMDIAARQERFFTQNSVYASSTTFIGDLGLTNGNQSENSVCTAAVATDNNNTTYTITITANPVDTLCGDLTLDNTGLRGSQIGDPAECWSR